MRSLYAVMFQPPIASSTMIGQYGPAIVAIGAVLAAYKLIGYCEMLDGITAKSLEEKYDYVIGRWRHARMKRR